jgi:hypothetical protein
VDLNTMNQTNQYLDLASDCAETPINVPLEYLKNTLIRHLRNMNKNHVIINFREIGVPGKNHRPVASE